MESPARLLQCSEEEFEKQVSAMDSQTLLETVGFLQNEMAREQARFDEKTSCLAEISDTENPEYETLSAELMAVQENLATLMARNMKCFNQQSSAQNQQNGSGGSDSGSLQNGDNSGSHFLNGHKQHRKTSPRLAHKSSSGRRTLYDDGEPDIAGYEESVSSNDEERDKNGHHLTLDFGSDGRHGSSRRDFHSPETKQRFIDYGPIGRDGGESSMTDDVLTDEKNKKNEKNLDERELLEQKALRDLESLMRFDEDPEPETSRPTVHKDPGKPFLHHIDDVTKGESYTDAPRHQYKEIDVDRIGEEDEGEEDDPSEWKYAGDGNNKIPDGPIIHTTAGATAQIFAESLVRRQRSMGDDLGETMDPDVYDVKRSTVTMVLRSSSLQDSHVSGSGGHGGLSKDGSSITTHFEPEVSKITAKQPTTATIKVRPSAAISLCQTQVQSTESNQSAGACVSDSEQPNGAGVAQPAVGGQQHEQTAVSAAARAAPPVGSGDDTTSSEGSSSKPTQAVGAAITRELDQSPGQDQNTFEDGGVGGLFANNTDSSTELSTALPPQIPNAKRSPDREQLAPTPDQQSSAEAEQGGEGNEQVIGDGSPPVLLATSKATLTLSPAPITPKPFAASTAADGGREASPNPILHAARVSLRTVSGTSSNSPPVRKEPEKPDDGPQYFTEPASNSPSSSSVSAAKVHFRSYPSLVAVDDSGVADRDSSQGDQAVGGETADGVHLQGSQAGEQLPTDNNTAAGDMGNTLDAIRREKEGDSLSVKSAVTPACVASEGFTADDKIKERTTLKDWDPTKLLRELYKIQVVQDEEEDFFEHITLEGYMEKLPINKKKATLLKTWRRRYFKTEKGYLYYYEPPDTVRQKNEDKEDSEKQGGSIQLMGGSVESLDNRMIGIDDGRGRYLIVRAPTEAEFEQWFRALKSQTVENPKANWIKPVVHAIPSRKRNVVIIDIGSCSVRAGVLGEQPSLPKLFFPCIMATNKNTGDRTFGVEAMLPAFRANCTLSYPVRPSVKADKFAVDMAAMPELFDKIFNDLEIDPSTYWVMFSAPGNFSDKIKSHFMDILVNRFHVVGVNILPQTLLSLYSYNSKSGIVVDVGERLEIVPVTDGYIVEAGCTRQPYGGHRITEALNSSFTESKYRFFTDVEFQIVRLAMEKSCYIATDYNAENRACLQNPKAFKKTIDLRQYGLPTGTWKNVTHTGSRFSSPEGLFNTELWGMDNPMMHKLIAKAVQVCPMDLRREIWRSIFLSGGVTLLPGFAERLQMELQKLAPPSIKVQVHASPQRYHSAFIGACALANLKEFEQACITADEWRENGPPCLRKWHMF